MVRLKVGNDLNKNMKSMETIKLKSVAMATAYKYVINKKHTWNQSTRPEEHLCQKQSIIYIKHHQYILGLPKSSALISNNSFYQREQNLEVLIRSF